MDKASLRRLVRERRRRLDEEATKRAGESLADPLLLSRPPFASARTVAGYLSLPGELSVTALLALCRMFGRRVAVPAWDLESRTYVFAEWLPGETLEPGPMRVPQPADLRPVAADSIDVALVPGLAFDREGGRVGFGAGWYDRLLPHFRPDATFLGVAFEWQLFNHVETGPCDIPMDGFLLPAAVLIPARRRHSGR